jgi:hypothetical protein
MPYEAYIGYLKDDSQETRPEITNGQPMVVEVRDLDTFERLVVSALVAEPPAQIEDGDELWVLDWVEKKLPTPWPIRVLEELEDDALEGARSDISDADLSAPADQAQEYGGGKYRGSQTPQMAGQEEARKFFENITKKK